MKFTEFLLNEDKMFALAKKAKSLLSDEAKLSIEEWVIGNWIGGRLEKHYIAKDEVAKEIQQTFDDTFKDVIPDTIKLYRGINDVVLKNKSIKKDIDSKHLESWTDDIRVAEWFAFLRETPRVKHEDLQKERLKKYDSIDDVVKRFNKNGYVVFDNKLYVVNKTNADYYDVWSLNHSYRKNNRYLGDGYTKKFKDDLMSQKEHDIKINLDINKNKGRVITKTFKRSDIFWYVKNPWNSSIEYIIKLK